MIEEKDWQVTKEALRGNLLKYTRKAFQLLPNLDRPDILDIGCGSGIPTLELAALSNGQITALDNDQGQLDILAEKIKEQGLDDRITILNKSMTEMAFPARSFNIIWAEGSIFVFGFRKALEGWRKLLKPNGFVVFHDDATDTKMKLAYIPNCGYSLITYFTLSKEIWWTEYYAPLENKIQKILSSCQNDLKKLANIKKDQQEIEMFKNSPGQYSSAFFIMQKCDR